MVLMMVLALYMAAQTVGPVTMNPMQPIMTAAVNMRRVAATAMETPQAITATVITI